MPRHQSGGVSHLYCLAPPRAPNRQDLQIPKPVPFAWMKLQRLATALSSVPTIEARVPLASPVVTWEDTEAGATQRRWNERNAHDAVAARRDIRFERGTPGEQTSGQGSRVDNSRKGRAGRELTVGRVRNGSNRSEDRDNTMFNATVAGLHTLKAPVISGPGWDAISLITIMLEPLELDCC